MKTIFTLLMAMLAFSACGEKETVSGEMIYHKGYEKITDASVLSSNSQAAALRAAVVQGINERITSYNKEWTVKFSGSAEDSALAQSDQAAVADFDAAVASMTAWKQAFDETKVSKDYGAGSFTLTYVVRVWRDKILKESDPIVFEYRYQK